MNHVSTRSLVVLMMAGMVIFGCAERRSPTDAEIKTHPRAWTHPQSEDFHGLKVRQDALSFCESCHGVDARGGTSGVSCYSECHAGGPGGHPARGVWLDPQVPEFHGHEVAETGPMPCQDCHGEDYRGGWAEVSCYLCHNGPSGHPAGWLNPNSPQFHGTVVQTVPGAWQTCSNCHGADLGGGTSGLACSVCHPPQ